MGSGGRVSLGFLCCVLLPPDPSLGLFPISLSPPPTKRHTDRLFKLESFAELWLRMGIVFGLRG